MYRTVKDVRFPLSVRNEVAAMERLLALTKGALAAYPTTLEEDQAALQVCVCVCVCAARPSPAGPPCNKRAVFVRTTCLQNVRFVSSVSLSVPLFSSIAFCLPTQQCVQTSPHGCCRSSRSPRCLRVI